MDYKTILVLTDTSASSDARIACACQLAIEHDAHLIGVTQSGVYRLVYGSFDARSELGDIAPLFADLEAEAALRAQRFDRLARQAGVVSFEHRTGDQEPSYALAIQALYADLVIVGQTDPDNLDTAGAGIPEYVALHAPCPVLVLPYAKDCRTTYTRVQVAWNASPEAARAVRQALPFLMRAAEVDVVTVGDALRDTASSGADITPFLARHGIKVNIWQADCGGDAADVLLSRASESGADLLVMGCYGHSRLREVLLGGVSRAALRDMAIPTLMAH